MAQYALELQENNTRRADKLGVSTKQLDNKLDKMLSELETAQATIQDLSLGALATLVWNKSSLDDMMLDTLWSYDELIADLGVEFKQVIEYLKSHHYDKSWLVYTDVGQYALHHPQAKNYIQSHGIS